MMRILERRYPLPFFLMLWALSSPSVGVQEHPESLEPPDKKSVKEPDMRRFIWWESDIEQALQQARERNVPIMILLSPDEGVTSKVTFHEVYPLTQVIRASRSVVPVAAYGAFDHGQVWVPDETGEAVLRCSHFLPVACKSHMAAYEWARARFVTRRFFPPLHVFLAPDTRELFRRENLQGADKLIELIEKATDEVGAGLSLEDYQELLATLDGARSSAEGGELKDARRGLARIDRDDLSPAMLARVEEAEEAVAEAGRRRLEELRTLAAQPEERAAAVRALQALERDFAGTPLADEIAQALRDLD